MAATSENGKWNAHTHTSALYITQIRFLAYFIFAVILAAPSRSISTYSPSPLFASIFRAHTQRRLCVQHTSTRHPHMHLNAFVVWLLVRALSVLHFNCASCRFGCNFYFAPIRLYVSERAIRCVAHQRDGENGKPIDFTTFTHILVPLQLGSTNFPFVRYFSLNKFVVRSLSLCRPNGAAMWCW